MDVIVIPLIHLAMSLINLYVWLLIIYVVMGWLEHFNIVNRYNRFVSGVQNFLFRVIEPALAPIRRVMPALGGMDLSPVLLILALNFAQGALGRLLLHF